MRAVIQRVSSAEVREGDELLGAIGRGLVVLLAVGAEDGPEDVSYLARKILNLRLFEDPQGKMNLSVREVGGELLIVSQFTLYGDCRKGNRPSFGGAAPAEKARDLYGAFLREVRAAGLPVAAGRFQASMDLSLVNQGPVTLLVDSRKGF